MTNRDTLTPDEMKAVQGQALVDLAIKLEPTQQELFPWRFTPEWIARMKAKI